MGYRPADAGRGGRPCRTITGRPRAWPIAAVAGDHGRRHDVRRHPHEARSVRARRGHEAGLKQGDQIIAVDGRVFPSLADLRRVCRVDGARPPGRSVDYIPAGGGPAQAQRRRCHGHGSAGTGPGRPTAGGVGLACRPGPRSRSASAPRRCSAATNWAASSIVRPSRPQHPPRPRPPRRSRRRAAKCRRSPARSWACRTPRPSPSSRVCAGHRRPVAGRDVPGRPAASRRGCWRARNSGSPAPT